MFITVFLLLVLWVILACSTVNNYRVYRGYDIAASRKAYPWLIIDLVLLGLTTGKLSALLF